MLNKKLIEELDPEEFSLKEKMYLKNLLYPPVPRPAWKNDLETGWRWSNLFKTTGTSEYPYRVSFRSLIARADITPPRSNGRTVSDFTSWVYSLYLSKPTRAQLRNGKRVERSIATMGGYPQDSDWELIFVDELSETPAPSKKITSMGGSGYDFYGRPDVVFQHKSNGEVLIVERKATNKKIPSDGWPNLRAQLWCYSQIDMWRNAPKIHLVGEVWGFDSNRVFPRATLAWSASDVGFYRSSQVLFEKYVKHFEK